MLKWNLNGNVGLTKKRKKNQNKARHSLQLRSEDHRHLFAGVVATETQPEEMVCADLPWAQHDRGTFGRGEVNVLGLTAAYLDLIPQGVVYDRVAVLTGGEKKRCKEKNTW